MSDSGLQACPPPLLGEQLYLFPCAGSQSLFSPAFQGPRAASEEVQGSGGGKKPGKTRCTSGIKEHLRPATLQHSMARSREFCMDSCLTHHPFNHEVI